MKKKRIVITSIIAGVIAIILFLGFSREKKQQVRLEVAEVTRGNIVNTVTATGTVEPIDKVVVGTQVSGVINKIYADYNSVVKKGQLLAEIDKSTLKARLLQSQADLSSAQNELTYQEQNFNRTKKLYETSMVSEVDYETALYKYNNAKTSVERLKSELSQSEVNLSYAEIHSPIDGVILSRNVEEGQTVAASFSTPTLFSIARDLTKMKVEAKVDEADIGQVRLNQTVNFTVDAYPEDKFTGSVTQIRLEPTTTSNVVTYTVIIEAPNPDQKLMPGLTASIEIVIKEAKDVLIVSPKALQFVPTQDLASVYTIEKFPEPRDGKRELPSDSGVNPAGKSGIPPMGQSPDSFRPDPDKMKVLWVKNGNTIKPQMVETGMGDGALIEIVRGVHEGDSIVTGITSIQTAISANTQGGSPFMPKPPQRNSAKKSTK